MQPVRARCWLERCSGARVRTRLSANKVCANLLCARVCALAPLLAAPSRHSHAGCAPNRPGQRVTGSMRNPNAHQAMRPPSGARCAALDAKAECALDGDGYVTTLDPSLRSLPWRDVQHGDKFQYLNCPWCYFLLTCRRCTVLSPRHRTHVSSLAHISRFARFFVFAQGTL